MTANRTIFLVIAALAAGAQAENWMLESGQTLDNADQFQSRAAASVVFASSPRYYWDVGADLAHTGSAELVGIPGGARTVGGLHATLLTGVKAVALKAGTGLTDMTDPASWLLMGQARMPIPHLPGFAGRLELDSRRQDQTWLAYGVRSSKGQLALSMERWNTWAEIGSSLDYRSGGEDPGAPLALALPSNRLNTTWAWVSRQWTKGFMAGMSAVRSTGTADLHQPTQIVDDTARWLDAPYSAPMDESSISALVVLKAWRLTLKGNCPVYSRTKVRADDIWGQQSERYYYWTSNMAPASAALSLDMPVSGWLVSTSLEANSRPYQSRAWFTDKAWNQFGLTLTFRH